MSFGWVLLVAHVLVGTIAAGHALLFKRDPRAALGWIAVCVSYPFVGALLYYMFGINRLETQAKSLSKYPHDNDEPEVLNGDVCLTFKPAELAALAQSSSAVTQRPLLAGNKVLPYFSGDAVYAAMLEAIDAAEHTISLASYIFDNNQTGERFAQSLGAAQRRGVDVRIVVDGVGELYSFPTISSRLRREGIDAKRFLPPKLLPPSLHINLRNHRKLLLVDGQVAFTGGMNIGDRHLETMPDGKPGTRDIHFRVVGPVISQLQAVFEDDWLFVSGKIPTFKPAPAPGAGEAICRVITDGPNDDLGKLEMITTGAIALARQRVWIMTPYFLPPPAMANALQAAALRGVDVSIVLPEKNNLALVHWATRNTLPELLQCGVKIFYQPAPFTHSKFMLVDEHYAHIGSANLDPRSLRLNFELVVEVFEADFVATLDAHFTHCQLASREETYAAVKARSLPVRLRDAAAWLFSPYL